MSGNLLTRLCPVCGREAKELYDGVCEECFKADRRLVEVPKTFEVTLCRMCGAYKLGGKWRKPSAGDPLVEAVEAEVRRSSKVRGRILSLEVSGVKGDCAKIRVVGVLREGMEPQKEEHEATLHVRRAFCPDCIMARSKREAARVQVRAKGRPMSAGEVEVVRRIVEQSLATRWRGSIDLFEVEEKEGGVDFLFSSQSSARLAAGALKRELFAFMLETRKAVGSVSGRRVARVTLRILLPHFRLGDVIEFDHRLFYVLSITHSGVKALCLQTYEEQLLSSAKSLIERSRVVLKREELEPAIVASVTGDVIDAVLLSSQKPIFLVLERKPEWLVEGKQVMLAFIGSRAYPVPLLNRYD